MSPGIHSVAAGEDSLDSETARGLAETVVPRCTMTRSPHHKCQACAPRRRARAEVSREALLSAVPGEGELSAERLSRGPRDQRGLWIPQSEGEAPGYFRFPRFCLSGNPPRQDVPVHPRTFKRAPLFQRATGL
jgi:hypothetical protein